MDSRLGTGKGNGAGRRSLVKYNQPQGTPRLELEERKLSLSDGRLDTRSTGAGRHVALVSMKNLLQRATTAAAAPDSQACVYIERWQTEARVRMAPRFRAASSNGQFRDVLQNGDVK